MNLQGILAHAATFRADIITQKSGEINPETLTTELAQAAHENPADSNVQSTYITHLVLIGQGPQALEHCRKLIEQSPENREYRDLHINTMEQLGKPTSDMAHAVLAAQKYIPGYVSPLNLGGDTTYHQEP